MRKQLQRIARFIKVRFNDSEKNAFYRLDLQMKLKAYCNDIEIPKI